MCYILNHSVFFLLVSYGAIIERAACLGEYSQGVNDCILKMFEAVISGF
jgi:hypothetical protein